MLCQPQHFQHLSKTSLEPQTPWLFEQKVIAWHMDPLSKSKVRKVRGFPKSQGAVKDDESSLSAPPWPLGCFQIQNKLHTSTHFGLRSDLYNIFIHFQCLGPSSLAELLVAFCIPPGFNTKSDCGATPGVPHWTTKSEGNDGSRSTASGSGTCTWQTPKAREVMKYPLNLNDSTLKSQYQLYSYGYN